MKLKLAVAAVVLTTFACGPVWIQHAPKPAGEEVAEYHDYEPPTDEYPTYQAPAEDEVDAGTGCPIQEEDEVVDAGTPEETDAGTGKPQKVGLCHVPRGNPAKRHMITIGAPAVAPHLAHGDYLGECQ